MPASIFPAITAARASRCLGAVLAGALGLWTPLAFGFSLGDAEVLSHLGEPLRMRVVLRQDPVALPIRAQLPDESSYPALGLPVPEHAVSDLSLSVSQRSASESVIHLRSTAPVLTPVLSLLLQLEVGSDTWIRRLDMLLDPRPTPPPPEPAPPRSAARDPQPESRPAPPQTAPSPAPARLLLERRLHAAASRPAERPSATPLPAYRFDWELQRGPGIRPLGPDTGPAQLATTAPEPAAASDSAARSGPAQLPGHATTPAPANPAPAALAQTAKLASGAQDSAGKPSPGPGTADPAGPGWPLILLLATLLLAVPWALRQRHARYGRWLAARIRGLVPWPAESDRLMPADAPYPIDWSAGSNSALGREIEQEIERQGDALDRRLLVVQALIERGREKDARRVLRQLRGQDQERSARPAWTPPRSAGPLPEPAQAQEPTGNESTPDPGADREQLDRRLADMRKGYLSSEVSRQLQVVEAFLNRGRLEQARRLLDTLSARV